MARTSVSTATLDPLTVSAIVLTDGDVSCALVAADLLGIDSALVADLTARLDWTPTLLVVCASHTHSGPGGLASEPRSADAEPRDAALRQRFIAIGGDVIPRARAELAPVTLHLGRATVRDVAANRNDPTRPVDTTVTTITMRQADTRLTALLVHFACHPTILGAGNTLLSADLFGAVRRHLVVGGKLETATPILCLNGAAADISTRFTRRGQDATEVDRLGKRVADAAIEAMGSAETISSSLRTEAASLQLRTQPVDLKQRTGASAAPEDEIAASLTTSMSHAERRIAVTRREGAALAARRGEWGPASIDLSLNAITIGQLALLTFPGELGSTLARQIEAVSPFETTLVLGYANGYAGYVVEAADFSVPTYESLASPFAPTAGDEVVRASRKLLHRAHHTDARSRVSRQESGTATSRGQS